MQKNYPHVLYLSYDGLTDPLGQSQILPYLAQLSKRGYNISVISAEKQENYLLRKELIERIARQNNIKWYPVFYTKKPPVLSTLWDIRKIQRLALQLCRQHNIRIIHCRSYISALIGLAIKKKIGARFIFDMRGFWADERVEGGIWDLSKPLYKKIYGYFKKKEKEFLQRADYTISLTHQAKQEIQSWHGLAQIPVQVIPCCVDTALFAAEDAHQPSIKNDSVVQPSVSSLPDSASGFILSYLGSLGTWYLLEEMLLFFKRLLLQKPEAKFLFITPDPPQLILQAAAALDMPANKFIIQKAERKEVPLLLAKSHVSIFFIKPCFSKKASSPTKMGEILSMGIPVICNAGVGDTDYLFEKYASGYLIKELNEANYDKAIEKLHDLLSIPAHQLRQVALTYFDLQKGVDLYDEVYQNLC